MAYMKLCFQSNLWALSSLGFSVISIGVFLCLLDPVGCFGGKSVSLELYCSASFMDPGILIVTYSLAHSYERVVFLYNIHCVQYINWRDLGVLQSVCTFFEHFLMNSDSVISRYCNHNMASARKNRNWQNIPSSFWCLSFICRTSLYLIELRFFSSEANLGQISFHLQ